MTIKTILAGLSGGTATAGAIALGCRLAKRFEAHLEGYHVRADPTRIDAMAAACGYAMPVDGAWIDQMTADAEALAKKTCDEFAAALHRNQIPIAEKPGSSSATACWRDEIGYAPAMLAARARYFDLTVLGRSERVVDLPATDTIEQTLIESGRPVLIAPSDVPKTVGETVAIGWNGSPQATRAIAAARPLLKQANKVAIITIGDKAKGDVSALENYFGWNGVAAHYRAVPSTTGSKPGDLLLAAAREEGADLLVMGGFGHGPTREWLFGGATDRLIGSSRLPLLMCH